MDSSELRLRAQRLVRALGLLNENRTPCGVDISIREAHALNVIFKAERAGQPVSQSDLEDHLGVDKSNVTRLVQQLASHKRVERRVSEADARVKLLRLTPKGRRAASALEDLSLARFSAVVARIPPAQRSAVLYGLDVFLAALKDLEQEPNA